ncbi:MAG: hypothetical protein II943_01745 [Victivallales bacterium]|nr:hypothetical protein [Victivallales bacterium]
MFKQLLCTHLSSFVVSLLAAVQPGENLISNGELQSERSDTPPICWTTEQNVQYLGYHSNGGPENRPYVSITNYSDEPTDSETVLRQQGLTLVAGERYHVSVWIRTVDFISSHSGVIIGNHGWTKTIGPENFQGTQDWTHLEGDYNLMESEDKRYFAAIFACQFTGELDIADFQLTAISEGAQQGSAPSAIRALLDKPLLVPWAPRLHRIPADTPCLTFRLFAPKQSNLADLDLEFTTSDTEESIIQPLQHDLNTIALPASAREGDFTAIIRHRPTGKVLFTTTQEFSVVNLPSVSTKGHRKLNNLVTEVLNAPLEKDGQTLSFTTERDGWVYVSIETDSSEQFRIIIDDSEQIMTNETPRHEAFRELSRGEHTLAIQGAAADTQVIVRSIAEIFNYCPCANSPVKENPPYDWAFHEKYGLPAITTQNGGNIPEEHREWFRAQGYRWLGNLNCVNPASPEAMTQLLNDSPGMNEPQYDGVTCDEQFFNQPGSLVNFTQGIRAYGNPHDHLIYTWIVGKPTTPGVDHDFLAACVDASHGRGKLLIEAYCRTKLTEQDAREYLDEYITETVRRFRKALPDVIDSTGVILGDFNQLPILSLHHHPEVDYKYYLDMQLNLVANAPEFEGLGCVGYWGSYYADHELHRWAYMLLRHYCVEGKTTMLSDEYGFSYLPGHVINGDFRGNFDGWMVQGDVTLDSCAGMASASQNRWGGNGGTGDTFAVFHKTGEETSTLTQTATGLVPGGTYLLQFVTFDADDAHNKVTAGKDIGIRATLGEGAVVREDLSWHHIDRRETGRYAHNNGCVRPNLHHIVFTAIAPQVTITLDNKLSHPGENLGVNFFAVTPFLDER